MLVANTFASLEARRDTMLSNARGACASVKDSTVFWKTIWENLSQNSLDFPFAFVHTVERSTSLGGILSPYFTMECSFGIDLPRANVPERFHIRLGGPGFIAIVQESLQLGTPVMFDTTQVGVSWPGDVYDKQRGFGETCKRAVVFAIPALDGALAFVTMGTLIPSIAYIDTVKPLSARDVYEEDFLAYPSR